MHFAFQLHQKRDPHGVLLRKGLSSFDDAFISQRCAPKLIFLRIIIYERAQYDLIGVHENVGHVVVFFMIVWVPENMDKPVLISVCFVEKFVVDIWYFAANHININKCKFPSV